MTMEEAASGGTWRMRVLPIAIAYIVSYVLGIVTCILFTPVDTVLVGKPLWPLYPVFAIIGYFLFYLYIEPQYVFGATFGYWLVYSLGLFFVVIGTAVHFVPQRCFRWWGPLLICFSLGFMGTMGVFYTAAASI